MDQRDKERTKDVLSQWESELEEKGAVPLIMISMTRNGVKDIKIHKAFGIPPDLLIELLQIAAKENR